MEQELRRPSRRNEIDVDRLQWGTLRDWGQLVRLPNVFTLISDCLVAAVVAVGMIWPLSASLPILLASLCAYWAGMILNDVVDLEADRESRPDRPLAAGKISTVVAGHVATGMLLIGPIVILAVMTFHASKPLWMGFAFLSSVLLSLAVRCYDSPLKRTPLGPVLMGLCRALNILMVGCAMLAVTFPAAISTETLPEEVLPRPLLALAAGIGLYIFGVTLYARREERESSPVGLLFGILLEVAGLVIIGCLPLWSEQRQAWTLDPQRGYPLLIALIGLTVVNRGLAGVFHPVSRKVQLAVRHAILTLILIDAAVVLMWAGAWYGCMVVVLLFPALASAVRFRST